MMITQTDLITLIGDTLPEYNNLTLTDMNALANAILSELSTAELAEPIYLIIDHKTLWRQVEKRQFDATPDDSKWVLYHIQAIPTLKPSVNELVEALESIAYGSMDLPMAAGCAEETKLAYHAEQAWRFISIAANALASHQSAKEEL